MFQVDVKILDVLVDILPICNKIVIVWITQRFTKALISQLELIPIHFIRLVSDLPWFGRFHLDVVQVVLLDVEVLGMIVVNVPFDIIITQVTYIW